MFEGTTIARITFFSRPYLKRKVILVRYQAGELSRLLDEVGRIDMFDFLLSLKVLNRMELQPK